MRKIKFRIWDNLNNAYDKDRYYAGEQFGHPSSVDWWAEQYTGIKDINDIEIYEGDIISINNGEYKGFVSWREDFAMFGMIITEVYDKETENESWVYFDDMLTDSLTVVGNINNNENRI